FTLDNYGYVGTSGAGAHGIVAQSIAGGGGVGGLLLDGDGSTQVTISQTTTLGAAGNGSGDGNAVTVLAGNDIVTTGMRSVALIAQSIGGGGGVVDLSSQQQASTSFSGTTTLGGAAGGAGGTVSASIINGWTVSTTGKFGHAIVAQSIGGGGGLSDIPASTLILGGSGGGAGGDVTVTTGSRITTSGSAAVGIIAQSIGGGGGAAIATDHVTFAGTSGDGGAVTATVGETITTSGSNSIGVLAQSIGGGGGAAIADGGDLSHDTPSGTGTGGAVTVNVNANITTTGAGAYGVLGQSVSNGGGLVMNGSTMEMVAGDTASSGKVIYNQGAGVTVKATGAGATAVYMQGSGDPIINIGAGGSVVGGAGGTAITSDGTETYITSFGSLSTVDGAEGMAIRTLTGFAQVTNGGTLTGNIALTSGAANWVTNLAGGTIAAGSTFDLGGTGNLLTNAGRLQSAADGLGAVTINGSLVQTATGVLAVRADQITGSSDTFTVSGTASLSGGVLGIVANPARAAPGHYDTAFLTALGGLSVSNLVALGDTAMLDFSLAGDGSGLTLGTTIDFTPGGLSSRGVIIGTLIGEIQNRGSSALFETIVPTLLEITSVGGLDQAYESVGGGAVSMVPQSLMNAAGAAMAGVTTQMDLWRMGLRPASSALGYAAAAAGTPSADEATGPNRFFWGSPMGSLTTGGGLSGSTIGGTAGIDGELAGGNTLLGAALNFSTSGLSDSAYGATVDSSFGSFSLYGLHQWGPAYVSAIVTAGYGSANFNRNLYNLGLNLATDSGFDSTLLGGRIEAGYSFALGGSGASLTPFIAFQPTTLWLGSGSEQFGTLGAGLSYDATTITALPLYLGVQVDGIWTAANGQRYAPYLRAAWMHDFSPARNVPRSFAELPGLSFTGSALPTVSNAADLHAGLQFLAGPNMALSAGLDAQIAESYSTVGASASFRVRW
ncbi:MAG: hypothetical protein B7X99_13520, partial [Rhizobiales bacterium 17-65-6]